ncbi:MAG: nucleoside 2-deoxyribosyltransferase [bacterium]|nr:nucleoside 2-deoxyribosyltransferase [bacterium]MDZ4285458.1 nucleoside 2-deoxyribosyltransferase [Candidatus Sungbacteria bacterium]
MSRQKDVKLYLAGPEVFLPNAVEYAEVQRELCRQYGFVGLHPMDNNIQGMDSTYGTATRIYRGDVAQVRKCDIVIANCNPFRGLLIDDGTSYELGFCNGLGKPSYGYIRDGRSYNQRAMDIGVAAHDPAEGMLTDDQGYAFVDDFTTLINLMMQCGMTEHGGRLVVGSFEDCLKAVRSDIDTGILMLS